MWGVVGIGGEIEVGKLILVQGWVIIQPGILSIGVGLLPIGVVSERVGVALDNPLQDRVAVRLLLLGSHGVVVGH